MKGLLLKDYYLIRDGMVILLLTFVAVGAGLAFLTSPWVLIVVAGATMSFQGAMTVQSDRSTQWDRFSAVLPLPRSTVVSENMCSICSCARWVWRWGLRWEGLRRCWAARPTRRSSICTPARPSSSA